MKVGDRCQYRAWDTEEWKPGTILEVRGTFSAREYVIAGTGHATGELVTKTSHYVVYATNGFPPAQGSISFM
jgi:hypothetical protein